MILQSSYFLLVSSLPSQVHFHYLEGNFILLLQKSSFSVTRLKKRNWRSLLSLQLAMFSLEWYLPYLHKPLFIISRGKFILHLQKLPYDHKSLFIILKCSFILHLQKFPYSIPYDSEYLEAFQILHHHCFLVSSENRDSTVFESSIFLNTKRIVSSLKFLPSSVHSSETSASSLKII